MPRSTFLAEREWLSCTKGRSQPGGFAEHLGVPAFHEEAARIAEHLGFEDQDFGQSGGGDLQNTFSCNRRSKYWP